MASKLSLRVRLSMWYSAIVAVSLLAFGAYTYFSVMNDLHSNLDASIVRVANSLDYVIKKKPKSEFQKNKSDKLRKDDKFELFRESERARFVGPLRPAISKSAESEETPDIVWSAVYEHILLNPRNYFIQVADTSNEIIWRSKNLANDSLPKLNDIDLFLRKDTISLKNKDSIINLTYDKDASVKIDSLFANLNIHGEAVRLLVKQTDNAVISIGYILSDINSTTNQLFAIQIIAFPFILIISVIGGLLLSKVSLKTIENITQEADAISASNLSNRLPVINTNDEVGHLTRTLNQMIERLESSFNQIKKFTSDASHELRTPLTILQGELEIALHSQKTPAQYEDIIISALEEVARLTNVVETLLDLSRAESGQVKMNLTEGSLTKLLIDMSEDAEILAESRGVNVTSEIEPDVNLPFDSARMHQAILNIVDNAIKYTKKGGNVLIQLIKTKDNAEIIISDTGNGIPADDLPYIFDRLYRVDKARSSNIFGVGLGLAIVKWIIEGHNGKISVESEVNKGTKFTIRLKLKH